MKKLLGRISTILVDRYIKVCRNRGRRPFKADMERKLSLVHPGVGTATLTREYYIGKVTTLLEAGLVSVILLVLIAVGQSNEHTIIDNSILRNTYNGGQKLASVTASTDSYDYGELELTIDERKYTEAEAYEQMDAIAEAMKTQIPGDNESLQCIRQPLVLPSSVSGMDSFTLVWESGDYLLLHDNGSLGDEAPDPDGSPVTLKLDITYGDYEKSYEYSLVLYPPLLTEEESRLNQLQAAITKAGEDSATDPSQQLPVSVEGEAIAWEDAASPIVVIMFIVAVALCGGIWLGTDRDTDKLYEDRNRGLALEYAEFVSKLQLLLSSGMTIRGAMIRMAADYEKVIGEGGERKYVYEELQLCVKKMQEGMGEATAYELWGRRCGLLSYKKLCSLIVQNLKKGNEGLSQALSQEVRLAFEDRKAKARKLGEEAQTKLIVPMIMMLGVVMIIIMIPAYMSFGGM